MTALNFGQQTSAIYLMRNAEPYDAWFNDPTNPDNAGALAGDDAVTGLDSPEIRENAANLVESHGGVHGNFWAGRRPITLTAQVQAATLSARNALLQRIRRASNQYTANGKLYIFPGDTSIVPTTRINLVPNPSFEYDTAGVAPNLWSNNIDAAFTSQIFQVAAANPLFGTNSLRLKGTKDNTATARTLQTSLPVTSMAVVPGAVYSGQASVFIADPITAGPSGFILQVDWYDANSGYLSSGSVALATGASGRQTLTLNGVTAPAGAAYAKLDIYGTTTSALDTLDIYIDAIQFVREPTAGAFFDSDTANGSWLGRKGQSPFINRPEGKVINTRRQVPSRVTGGWIKSVLIGLVAADPRIYSSAVTQQPMNPATNYTVENQGDWESPPSLIQVTGPGVNPIVKCTANGVTRQIAFTGLTLTGGQYLLIDPLNKTVIRDNGTNMFQYVDFLNTQWWGLMPGPTNVVRTDWTSGTTGASITYMNYSDAWM